ncbi:MAG: hypothetical protein WCX97_03580 [Candidatus Magasanikbacteria bacterium]
MQKFLVYLLALGLSFPWIALGVMSSTHYYIYADSFDNGGIFSTSTLYNMQSTLGESPVGTVSSTTYEIRGGYQAMERGSLSLLLGDSDLSLGVLSVSTVSAASTTATVTTDSATGYNLSVASASWTQGTALAPVAITTFSAGTEAFGMTTSTVGGLEGNAFALTAGQPIVSASGPVTSERTVLVFRAAIASGTTSGNRTHQTVFQAAANF